MAIALGTENKRQVRLVIGLFVAIAGIAAWEILGSTGHPSAANGPKPVPVLRTAYSPGARDISRLEPVLRIDQISRSEQVDYSASGRNVFSAVVPPAPIEEPIAPARPSDGALEAAAAAETAKPPAMDLKYLGYAQRSDKSYSALFLHGEDMFVAKTGDIMFHRFKVGVIQPASVQVTDLSYHNTQSIPVTAN